MMMMQCGLIIERVEDINTNIRPIALPCLLFERSPNLGCATIAHAKTSCRSASSNIGARSRKPQVLCRNVKRVLTSGGTENAGLENAGPNFRVENARPPSIER